MAVIARPGRYTFWFPKAFGFTLDERWGKAAFWFWFTGFYVAFMPLYALGLMGATRRMQHYADASWQPLMIVAMGGALLIFLGIACTVIQLVVSIRTRERRRVSGDPWNGRTLEWLTTSPPPAWNFAILPRVSGLDAFWSMKQAAASVALPAAVYRAIHIPRRSAAGIQFGFVATFLGFSLIWHIWWLACVALVGVAAISLGHAWRRETEEVISALELKTVDQRGSSA